MRSATSSHRRLHPRPAPPRRVEAIARLVDEGTAADEDHALVHVVDDGDDLILGLEPLDVGIHPFDELAGFTAPVEWAMFGLCVWGTVRHLDEDLPPQRMRTTCLVSRDGEESSVLRTPEGPVSLPRPAMGTVPDLCRRVLGLPTDPPPPTTAGLWTVAWLDRLIDTWGDPARRRELSSSWALLAALHPAVAATEDPLGVEGPDRFVAVARAHTREWGWGRLRAEPDALPLPDGHLPVAITSWMDDGFYARWALGAFPSPASLAHDLTGLLDAQVRGPFLAALEGLLAPG